MRRALSSHVPSAPIGVLPSSTRLASVMLAAVEPWNPGRPARLSTTRIDDSRSPYAAPNPPAVSSKLSTVSGLKALAMPKSR